MPRAEKVQLNYLLKANPQVTRQVKVLTRGQFKQTNKPRVTEGQKSSITINATVEEGENKHKLQ